MSTRTIYVVACAIVVNKHLLLVRKQNTSKFMLPGGKIAMGENDYSCLTREVMEELGCQLNLQSLYFLGRFTTAANEMNSFVTAQVYGGHLLGNPISSSEIAEIFWFSCNSSPMTISLAPLVADRVLPRLLELNYL